MPATDMPDALNITDAIFERAALIPDTLAVIAERRSLTYRELCLAIRRAANQFAQAGWKAGDIVGISLSRDPMQYLVCALALARMGVIQVSVPSSDSVALRAARIQRLGITALVIDQRRATAGLNLTTVMPDPGWFDPTMNPVVPTDIRAPGGTTPWIINETSGTTAAPKAIGLTHIAEDAHRSRRVPLFSHRIAERYLSMTGLRFLTAFKRAIYCLSDGGTLTLPSTSLTTEQFLDWVSRHQVAFVSCVPMHLHQFLRDIHSDTPCLPSLRILRSGSAALSPSAVQEIRKRISPNLYINYGITEAGPVVTATPAMLEAHPDTAGLPLEGVELGIVDYEDNPLPRGATGHVRMRGPGIEGSYWSAQYPGQSQAFRGGWFYPGDVGFVNSEGLVFLKGRSDDVMNFDGIMVGPVEIESVLRQHPAVKEVAAFALPSAAHQDIPAVAIVSTQPLPLNELKHFCADRLGVRAPRVFLQFDEIPKNPMGKVVRSRVTELALQQLKKQSSA